MYGLLRANFTRRTLSLAAALALPGAVTAALLGMATPAQASPLHGAQAGTVSVAIDSMSPQAAGPGATVTVTGTVSNGTGQTKAGLDVQLYTSPTRFASRDVMDGYASQGGTTGLETAGSPFSITASLRPGATVAWHASFQVNVVGMTEFGVYPVAAEVADQFGDVMAGDQTLLPFWPGQQAAGLARPLDIGWIWPLIDQPHHQVCPVLANDNLPTLTNNNLATSLGRQGRLSALLAAGRAHPGANLTWVIDPALVGDVQTMTGSYQVASGAGCPGAAAEPASRAAAAWLSALRAITASQPTVLTPYANVDAAALVHAGLNADLTGAYATGYQVADSVLHGSFGPSIALPAGGTADRSLLTELATAEGIHTVVLDSARMSPVNSAVFEDDAVTSIRVGGTTMTVLLGDHVLTGVLQGGDTGSGILPQSTQFSVSQRFLAETAMIAAEAPDSYRSIVVAPPDNWSPSAALAGQLLAETTSAPWLAPTPLADLARSPDTARSIARQQPPASSQNQAELGRGYLLGTVSKVGAGLGAYQAMLYQPSKDYQQSLNQALVATESSAWRGSGMPQGLALADSLSHYLNTQESKVRIIAADQVSMAGASGAVPVSIQNELAEAIRVRVYASVVNSPDRTSQLTVGRFRDVIVVPPHDAGQLVRLPVSSAPQGSTVIQLSLTSADGTPVPGATKSLTVLSTRYGRAILFLIGAAIGVMILASGYRGVRRWLHAETHVASEDAGQPGSVGVGTSTARHPTEAPDDLADARRWADDP